MSHESAKVFTSHKAFQAKVADIAISQIDFTFFQGLTFALFGFSEVRAIELTRMIARASGLTVEKEDFSKTVAYMVVDINSHDLKDVRYKYQEIVTDLWIVSITHRQCL